MGGEYREPIFHDRQGIEINNLETTSNDEFEDIPGAVLITKDLSTESEYMLFVTAQLSHSQNNSSIGIRIHVDGIPDVPKTISFGPNSANNPQTIPIIINEVIPSGSEVKVQWSTPSGTASLTLLEMVIDGIPKTRIVD